MCVPRVNASAPRPAASSAAPASAWTRTSVKLARNRRSIGTRTLAGSRSPAEPSVSARRGVVNEARPFPAEAFAPSSGLIACARICLLWDVPAASIPATGPRSGGELERDAGVAVGRRDAGVEAGVADDGVGLVRAGDGHERRPAELRGV